MQSETLGKAGVSLLLISCYCQVPDFVVDGSHHSYLGMGFLRYIVYIYIYMYYMVKRPKAAQSYTWINLSMGQGGVVPPPNV